MDLDRVGIGLLHQFLDDLVEPSTAQSSRKFPLDMSFQDEEMTSYQAIVAQHFNVAEAGLDLDIDRRSLMIDENRPDSDGRSLALSATR